MNLYARTLDPSSDTNRPPMSYNNIADIQIHAPNGINDSSLFQVVAVNGTASSCVYVSRSSDRPDHFTQTAFQIDRSRGDVLCCSIGKNNPNVVSVGCLSGGYMINVDRVRGTSHELINNNFRSSALSTYAFFDGNKAAFGLRNGYVKLYDSRGQCGSIKSDSKAIHRLHSVQNDQQIIAVSLDGHVFLYDWRNTARFVKRFDGHVNQHSNVGSCIDDTESLLYLAGNDGIISCWDIQSNETNPVMNWSGLSDGVIHSVDFIPRHLRNGGGLLFSDANGVYTLENNFK